MLAGCMSQLRRVYHGRKSLIHGEVDIILRLQELLQEAILTQEPEHTATHLPRIKGHIREAEATAACRV